MTDIIPLMTSALSTALVAACGTQANLRVQIEEYSGDDACHVLGICLEGPNKGLAIKVKKLDSDVQACATTQEVHMHALEGNALSVPAGTKLTLAIGGHGDETQMGRQIRRFTIGAAFNPEYAMLQVDLVVDSGGRARSQLKQVILPNGTVLNRDMSVRAVCAWLNKQNKIYASLFGVERLVWCEESSSWRSDRNQVRVFYRVDLHDQNRKKTCGNINRAIECMENLINRDFFEDMRTEGDTYDI